MNQLYFKSILLTLFFTGFLQHGYGVNRVVHNVSLHENVLSKKEHKAELKAELKQIKKELKAQKKTIRKEKQLAAREELKGKKTWLKVLIILVAIGLLGLLILGFETGSFGSKNQATLWSIVGGLAIGVLAFFTIRKIEKSNDIKSVEGNP